MKSLGLDRKAYLANNDATAFFAATGDLLLTGPTLTNVNDVRVILVESRSRQRSSGRKINALLRIFRGNLRAITASQRCNSPPWSLMGPA